MKPTITITVGSSISHLSLTHYLVNVIFSCFEGLVVLLEFSKYLCSELNCKVYRFLIYTLISGIHIGKTTNNVIICLFCKQTKTRELITTNIPHLTFRSHVIIWNVMYLSNYSHLILIHKANHVYRTYEYWNQKDK